MNQAGRRGGQRDSGGRDCVRNIHDEDCIVGAEGEVHAVELAFYGFQGGLHGSFADGQDALARPAQRYEPEPERAHAYRRMYAQFRAAEAALAPVSHVLAGIRV